MKHCGEIGGLAAVSLSIAAELRVATGAAVCSGTVPGAGGCIVVVVGWSTSKGARAGVDGNSGVVGGTAPAEVAEAVGAVGAVEAVEAVDARRVFALPRVLINDGRE